MLHGQQEQLLHHCNEMQQATEYEYFNQVN